MNQAFVGKRSLLSSDELKDLLENLPATSRCYFLRWVHTVSGFVEQLPEDFPSPEGEMLTPEFELRWKQIRQGYEVLLLQIGEPDPNWKFTAIGTDWGVAEPGDESIAESKVSSAQCLQNHPAIQQRPDWLSSDPLAANLHPNGNLEDSDRQDTRYPNPFIYPSDLKLHQRYFQNQHTGTIHFVALTLAPSEVKAS